MGGGADHFQERVLQRVVQHLVDALVPQVVDDILEVIEVVPLERLAEQVVDVLA